MEHAAIIELRSALNQAPKSTRGFVNWVRNRNLQSKAIAAMIADGFEGKEAKQQAASVGEPFDCYLSKKK